MSLFDGCFPCTLKENGIFLQESHRNPSEEFALIQIIKKVHEFDRLKKVLLDEDEIMMISYSHDRLFLPKVHLPRPDMLKKA